MPAHQTAVSIEVGDLGPAVGQVGDELQPQQDTHHCERAEVKAKVPRRRPAHRRRRRRRHFNRCSGWDSPYRIVDLEATCHCSVLRMSTDHGEDRRSGRRDAPSPIASAFPSPHVDVIECFEFSKFQIALVENS